MLERVPLSLLLQPSRYCGEINVVIICGPPFTGFPHPSPPASSPFLSRRLFSYLPSHTFFCLLLPVLKELKFSVCTWSLGVHTFFRVKSLCFMGGSVKLCCSVWVNTSCCALLYGCLVKMRGTVLGHCTLIMLTLDSVHCLFSVV